MTRDCTTISCKCRIVSAFSPLLLTTIGVPVTYSVTSTGQGGLIVKPPLGPMTSLSTQDLLLRVTVRSTQTLYVLFSSPFLFFRSAFFVFSSPYAYLLLPMPFLSVCSEHLGSHGQLQGERGGDFVSRARGGGRSRVSGARGVLLCFEPREVCRLRLIGGIRAGCCFATDILRRRFYRLLTLT